MTTTTTKPAHGRGRMRRRPERLPAEELQRLYQAALRDAAVMQERAERCVALMGFADDPDSLEADTAREIVYHQRTPEDAMRHIEELHGLQLEA